MINTTGWPPGLMQDDSRELSRWLSERLGAKHQVREVAHKIRAALALSRQATS